ncbi:zinc-binding loop region of homing endonuclease-domain-containing protein [Lipomyces doorenjongii]
MGTRSPPSPGDASSGICTTLPVRKQGQWSLLPNQSLEFTSNCFEKLVYHACSTLSPTTLNLMDQITGTSSNSMNGSEKGFASFDHPLKLVDKDRWIATIERLKYGYTSTNGIYFPPAVITANGCQLAQRSLVNDGYIHVPPVTAVTGKARKDVQKKSPILSLRIAWCATWQRAASEVDVRNLLYGGYQASHLCHQQNCINPDHLVVETQQVNLSRKMCSVKVNVKTSVNGRDYFLKAEECPHSPPCIIRLEDRAAIEL